MSRWLTLVLMTVACDTAEPPLCEVEDRATCLSSLRVSFIDRRSDFEITLSDDVGLKLTAQCPDPDTGGPNQVGAYTWSCIDSGVTIETDSFFGDTLSVGVGQLPTVDYELDLSRGGDRCGNGCNNASLEI